MNITELAMLKKMAGKGGNGTTVSLDKTLTKEGYAADAKAVGDALAKLGGATESAEIYIIGEFGDGTRVKSLYDYITLTVSNGAPVELNIMVVDALPDTLIPITDLTGPYNIYVDKSTGIAYGYVNNEVQTIGSFLFGADRGWTTDINAETENGFYCVRTVANNASGGGILDVDTLPTDDINENAIYRVKAGLIYYNNNGYYPQGTTYFVDDLPTTGEPCTLDGNSINAIYYSRNESDCYGYVPSSIAPALGVPAGWYTVSMLLGALGYTWDGIVGNIGSIMENGTFYFLKNPSYNACKDGVWEELSKSGRTALRIVDNKLSSGALKKAISDFENTEIVFTISGVIGVAHPMQKSDDELFYSLYGVAENTLTFVSFMVSTDDGTVTQQILSS
jgi:hypothetical protein